MPFQTYQNVTLARINAKLKELTGGMVELEKGRGYQYFIFNDGGKNYETQSEMVCYLKHMPVSEWVSRGVTFYNEQMRLVEIAQ